MAANAITILKHAGFSFSRLKLNDVNIQNSDLSKAILDGADLQNAILNYVNFTNASLNDVNSEGASLKEVDFGKWPLVKHDGNQKIVETIFLPDNCISFLLEKKPFISGI